MSCYHPLQAIKIPKLVEKKDGSGFYQGIKIVSSQAPPLESYQFTIHHTGEVIDVDPFKIPCGRCLGCRLDYSRAWANRMTLESITMDECFKEDLNKFYLFKSGNNLVGIELEPWFITFTYDDYHLPMGRVNDDGSQYPTLLMEDFQLFMKRLRERLYRVHGFEGSLEYYYCGEYGDHSSRPHYHAIIWNLPLYNLRFYTRTKNGDLLYNDHEITDLWGKGYVVIAKANWSTCAYVARYVMKKQNMTHSEQCELFGNIGIQPPYVRMSRRPGVGLTFYEMHKNDIYMRDQIVLPARTRGETFNVKPPHIFDTKYGEEFPFELHQIKMNRSESAKVAENNLLAKCEKDPILYLIDAEETKKKDIQSLRRML